MRAEACRLESAVMSVTVLNKKFSMHPFPTVLSLSRQIVSRVSKPVIDPIPYVRVVGYRAVWLKVVEAS